MTRRHPPGACDLRGGDQLSDRIGKYGVVQLLADLRAYTCPVLDCEASLRSGSLMCARHWRLVPTELRQELYGAVRRQRRAARAHHRVSGGSGVIDHSSPAEQPAIAEWVAADQALRDAQLAAVIVADERAG